MVLSHVFNDLCFNQSLKEGFVVFSPFLDRKLINDKNRISGIFHVAVSLTMVSPCVCWNEFSCKAFEIWFEFRKSIAFHLFLQCLHNVHGIELRNIRRIPSCDSFSSIDQDHGDDWYIVLRLYLVSFLIQVT